ncbi:MAG: DUF3488 and transglutaminase-like domain-containing protein [Ferrimonas sp.]
MSHHTATPATTLSRTTQAWMMVTQLLIILPLSLQLNLLTGALLGGCLLWRVALFFGYITPPPNYFMTLLAIVTLAILGIQLPQHDSMGLLINLLLLGYGLKSIEARSLKDLMMVVLTGYFLIGLQLLNHFGAFMGLVMLVQVALNSCALLDHYHPNRIQTTLAMAAKLVLLSVPLALGLFFFFPKLPPIWQLQSSAISRTGLSDSMMLGQIAQLTRSDELVLRATFDGTPPPMDKLYWRALVLDTYQDNRWYQAHQPIPDLPENPIPTAEQRAEYQYYQLQLEANNQYWLPILAASQTHDPRVQSNANQRLTWRRRLTTSSQLALFYPRQPAAVEPLALSPQQHQQNLQLPPNGNLESRQFAQQLHRQSRDSQDFMRQLMQYFQRQPFHYTLSPPPLGEQQIDDFLFQNRAGFCGHYASAMVFLARAAGIPARIITGYQGGEFARDGQFLSVYQYNAHAWVEFWQAGIGWQFVDPTAAVAPERVEQGAEATFANQAAFRQAQGWLSWRNNAFLGRIRDQWETFDYQWSQHITRFNRTEQRALWQRWLGEFAWWKWLLLGIAMMLFWGLIRTLRTWRKQRRLPIAQRYYQQGQQWLMPWQLQRKDTETPLQHLQRLQQQAPQIATVFAPFSHTYMAHQYQATNTAERHRLRTTMRTQLRAIKVQLRGLKAQQVAKGSAAAVASDARLL